MVRITEELVRKKSEHNEGEITTLEELSLHQENVEKIEHLQDWCKNLEILLLQANIISRIENLGKLKRLKYLNLAINCIEVVENLERCESLEKLDLTLNFIGNLESVSSLRKNEFLREMYLTGNPCTDYKGYREYVVAKLPQLERLDDKEITRGERIKSLQVVEDLYDNLIDQQEKYYEFRRQQKFRLASQEDVPDEEFWEQKSENAPETRVKIAEKSRKREDKDDKKDKEKKPVKLFAENGRPLNVNQPKVDFTLDDRSECFVLDLAVYRYLETSYLDVDIQPMYVRVTVKGKVFQMALPEEVTGAGSSAQRSQTTGHLVVTIPKLHPRIITGAPKEEKQLIKAVVKNYLEVENNNLDICSIVCDRNRDDNDEVPPLE